MKPKRESKTHTQTQNWHIAGSDDSTKLVWAGLSPTTSKLMLVRVNELRNQCLATLELDENSREWMTKWTDEAQYKDEAVIQTRIEIMEMSLAKYVSDKLDKANGRK